MLGNYVQRSRIYSFVFEKYKDYIFGEEKAPAGTAHEFCVLTTQNRYFCCKRHKKSLFLGEKAPAGTAPVAPFWYVLAKRILYICSVDILYLL